MSQVLPPEPARLPFRWRFLDGALLVALLAGALAGTRAYVSRERYFYFWDLAVYQDIAWNTATAFQQSWAAGWEAVGRSLYDDYNALFALPFVLLLPYLGDTRRAYEYCLVCFGLVPLALSLGVLAATLCTSRRRLAFWSASVIVLLLPAIWIPTLRGYPDASAAAFVVLATALFLRDERRQSRRDAFFTGVLLVVAVLIRRHFVYALSAFVATAALHGALCAVAARGGMRGRLKTPALRLAVLVGGAATTFAALGLPFLSRLVRYDLLDLYASYEMPASETAEWFLGYYGWLLPVGALLGWFVAWRRRSLRGPRVAFIVLLGAVATAQWIFFVRQLGEHYSLHFTPVLGLGLWALLWSLWQARSAAGRILSLASAALLLGLNLAFALGGWQQTMPGRSAFAGGWSPLIRWDYDAIAGLVADLRASTRPEDGIFVAASSFVLNPDLLRHAETALYGRGHERLRILYVPAIDSRDRFPQRQLLEAQIVLLTQPAQFHLDPGEQDVVTVVHRLFGENAPLARDFAGDPTTTALGGGVVLSVFRRTHPTTLATALQTLRAVRRAVGDLPGRQPEWTIVNRRFTSWLSRNADGTTRWAAHPAPEGQPPGTIAAYLGDVVGPAEASGQVTFVDARCQGATLEFSMADTSRRQTPIARVQLRPGEARSFATPLDLTGQGPLLLSIHGYEPDVSIDYCLLIVDPLRLRSRVRQ